MFSNLQVFICSNAKIWKPVPSVMVFQCGTSSIHKSLPPSTTSFSPIYCCAAEVGQGLAICSVSRRVEQLIIETIYWIVKCQSIDKLNIPSNRNYWKIWNCFDQTIYEPRRSYDKTDISKVPLGKTNVDLTTRLHCELTVLLHNTNAFQRT